MQAAIAVCVNPRVPSHGMHGDKQSPTRYCFFYERVDLVCSKLPACRCVSYILYLSQACLEIPGTQVLKKTSQGKKGNKAEETKAGH